MSEETLGKVMGIAVRSSRGGPMREITHASLEVGGGVDADLKPNPDRGVTLLSARQWAEALAELKAELPWHARRANLLVDRARLADLVGRRIRIGEAELAVNGETLPCQVMDDQFPGLRNALKPEMRGGVFGRVLRAGRIEVGSPLTLLD